MATLIFLIAAAFIAWSTVGSHGIALGQDPFQSPIPTPSPPSSPETQIALDYIAAREGIPVERLLVVNQHRREYDVLGKTFWYVKVLDRKGRHSYTALIDLSDQIPAELNDVKQAANKAMEAKYGKLEPQLYELLQTKDSDDAITIAVWFTPVDHETVLAQLRAKHSLVPLELPERPWKTVKDRDLSAQIEADYVQLMQETHLAKQEDLAGSLRAQEYTVRLHRGIPSLVAKLPKRVILDIAQRADVTRLYLIEGKLNPLLDKAISTAKGDLVWQRGIDGAAERIAIVEPGEANLWHFQIDVKERRWVADQIEHTSWVASAAASIHPTYKGMAPGADIYSAGVNEKNDQWDDVDDAILWAYNRACRIMNASFTTDQGERTDHMQWIDRVFDYYARYYNITMIVAAGNQEQGNHIGSPAKGYNVLAIGGTDDRRSPLWADDVMWPNSSWKNPRCSDGTYGDREKPEVVASAKGLTLLNNDGSPSLDKQGTSYSAPQVAGLAALLAERNTDLLDEPEAMRAIIMASAVHNIDGPSGIPTGQDLKDGAGAIDAALADSIAGVGYEDVYQYPYPACEKPCWWSNRVYNNYPGHPGNFPPGTHRWYYFKATRGERIRVALAWVSDPAGPGGGYAADLLHTDLDLAIFDPDGQGPVTNGYSASNDNNYEIVDFVAEKTGQYSIGVYKASGTTEYLNWIGLAWVKDATYLPDIRANAGGWTSHITLRNSSPVAKAIEVTFHDANGIHRASTSNTVQPNATWRFLVSNVSGLPWNFQGSAIVNAGEEVSVIARNQTSDKRNNMIYTGVGPPGAGSQGWDEAGTEIYVPGLVRDMWNWNSTLYVQNVGSAATMFTLTYYDSSGAQRHSHSKYVARNGRYALDLWSEVTALGNYDGAATITASQPLAVTVWQRHDWAGHSEFNALGSKAGTVYVADLYKAYYNWNSSVAVFNPGDTTTTVYLDYIPDPGYGDPQNDSVTLDPHDYHLFYQPTDIEFGSFHGSAILSSSNGGIVAVAQQQLSGTNSSHQSYSGVVSGAGAASSPFVRKSYSGWTSSLRVQNVGAGNNVIQRQYYDQVGGSLSPLSDTIPAGASREYYAPAVSEGLPGSFGGSAAIYSTNGQLLAGISNVARSYGGDLGASFNLPPR